MENYKDCCIVSCAFREPYLTHSDKQLEIIKEFNHIRFIDQLPYKEGLVNNNIVERFQKSLYGFKPHAIQFAISLGFKKIVWFDPSVLPTVSPKVLFDSLDEHHMIVVKGDNPINNMVNEKAIRWFGVDRINLGRVNHIGGTIYGFNFNEPMTNQVFQLWKSAEEKGIFGTQDEFMAGHWADEACMVLAMQKIGVKQYSEEKFTYLNQKEIPA